MSQPDPYAGEEVQSFGAERPRRVLFKMYETDGPEGIFEAARELPTDTMLEFATLSDRFSAGARDDASMDERRKIIRDVFRLVLLEESYERFERRLGDLSDPIALDKIPNIIQWLFERYGMRPTGPSSPSPGGDVEGGTHSPDGPRSVESISAASPSTGS